MTELDRAVFDFCEALGFHFDFGAPSHVQAWQELKRKIKEILEEES